MVRETPKLDLTPELTEPNSEDFNLFYKPETKPLPAGLEIFAQSLDRFVNEHLKSNQILAKYQKKQILTL